MKTLLVSGNDTEVGKTWVLGTIASFIANQGQRVQLVKPVETGVLSGSVGDIQKTLSRCNCKMITGFTLRTYEAAIAPASAAKLMGSNIATDTLIEEINGLPDTDWRILEGAGSLASPIDDKGNDWADLANAMGIDRTVLVVRNQIGAIGQARMLYHYAVSKGLLSGIWLNEVNEQDAVLRESTLHGIEKSGLPIWGIQLAGAVVATIDQSSIL